MKLDIFDYTKSKVGEIELPSQFYEEFRPDIIQRAVLSIQSRKRQSYAASPLAGKRASAKLSRRRRDYKGSYGFGISRVPRKIMTKRGTRMNWVGAFAPGTVGGRRAHPPKSEKLWELKINTKERLKAIRSAISSTILRDLVTARGHILPKEYPFVLDDKFESLNKTKDVTDILVKLGFESELERANIKKVRAGKGKARGRKYKKRKGPLIVVSEASKLSKAFANIPGVDVASVRSLNAELLAPGAKAGRLTLWTVGAINTLQKEDLFN
ncbi:50S ribosomal protein L4 [Candidatus Woesearchaeota archaeon]|nr:50S ribosomal protein L4 [Candidatus Woesearchaeota archaeon]